MQRMKVACSSQPFTTARTWLAIPFIKIPIRFVIPVTEVPKRSAQTSSQKESKPGRIDYCKRNAYLHESF
jgi:hypothetical protein